MNLFQNNLTSAWRSRGGGINEGRANSSNESLIFAEANHPIGGLSWLILFDFDEGDNNDNNPMIDHHHFVQ